MANRRGKSESSDRSFIFLGSKITADGDCSYEVKRCLLLGRKAMTNLDSILKSRDITLLTKVPIVKTVVFPVVIYDCKSWTVKRQSTKKSMPLNCGAGEDSWASLRQQDETSLMGNKPWIFIERTAAEPETPVFWSPDVNSQLIGKVPDAWKDWGQKEKRVSEEEMAGWHHWWNRHDLSQTLGDGEGQGGLACHSHRVANSQTQLDDWTIMHIC